MSVLLIWVGAGINCLCRRKQTNSEWGLNFVWIHILSLFRLGWPKSLVLKATFSIQVVETSTSLAFLGRSSCCRTGTSGIAVNSTSVWILTAINPPLSCSRDVETTLDYFEGSPQIQPETSAAVRLSHSIGIKNLFLHFGFRCRRRLSFKCRCWWAETQLDSGDQKPTPRYWKLHKEEKYFI